MSTTYNIVIVPTKKNKKEGYLKLRTITNRKPKDTSLGYTIQIKNFNKEKQYVYARETNADEINKKIQEVLLQAKGGKTKNFKTSKESFIGYAEKVIEVINAPNTKKGKTDALNKIREYLSTFKKEDITFSEIDIFFVRGYYNYLLQNLAVSTANEYITIFKYFVNQVKENQVFHYTIDPFQGLQKKKSKRRYKVLDDNEIKTFLSHTFSNNWKNNVQYSFSFMMYASGMRISDFLRLKWSNFHEVNGKYYIKYLSQKSGVPHESSLTLEALRFLRPFLETYKEGSLKWYDKVKEDYDTVLKDVIEIQEEYDNIRPKSYTDLFYENISVDNFYQLNQRIEEESKKEKKKVMVASKLKAMKELVPTLEQDMMRAIGSTIMDIKDSYGDEFVFPKMRGTPPEDVHKKTHSMSGNFNHYLTSMGKEVGIKKKISNHQARHIFAQRLFVAGANFHFISIALGHSSLQVTENYREQLVTDEAKDVSILFSETLK